MAKPLSRSTSAMVAAWLVMCPRMLGNPVLKFASDRIPTSWWLRPVSSAARVGEHSGVTWKFVYRSPSAASLSMCGVLIVDP